jgi:Protein of unknown function (DUF2817)
MTATADAYFSVDYQMARKRFLLAAERAGAELEHHALPEHRGPDGMPLYIDLAWLGPAAADVVLLSLSGTHGAEGFCGSAAQLRWLDERPAGALPPGVAQLLVHAVNPFGFAHMVRCNENNVDLNRNFVDFTRPLPANPLYEELDTKLPSRIGVDEDLVEEWASVLEGFWSRHGDWSASDALSRGQYTNPYGLQYGGQRPQFSASVLTSRIGVRCSRARHVVYLDWHSLIRVGDGKQVFLCFNQTGGPLFERVASWWGSAAIDRGAVNRQWGEGVERSERRPSRNGLVMWGLQHAVAPSADLAGAVIEFCADPDSLHGNLRARARLYVQERWLLKNRAYESPTGRYVVAALRESISPTRRSFQDKALEVALQTYSKALEGAAAWAREDVAAEPGQLVHSAAFE